MSLLSLCPTAQAQEDEAIALQPSGGSVSVPLNDQRILGVIPDYQTVRDSSEPVAPMSVKQKWRLVWKESLDPFNIATSALSSGFSQADNQTPSYGVGARAYAQRFGAAVADLTSQEVFSDGVLACLLHQDPRYFRMGPSHSFTRRVAYSLSRMVVTRTDSGNQAFNASGLGGMLLGIGMSNAYYPPGDRTGAVMVSRIGTSLFGGVTGNLMSEFWPDVQNRFFHRKHKKQESAGLAP